MEESKKLKNEGNQVFLVAGTINSTGRTLFWKLDFNLDVEDYVIVENMSGYDLVKVVGIILTEKKLVRKLSGVNYEDMKKAIKKVNIEK